ncbi:MAG: hypothetical protein M1821_008225 [Bathelium mastoideum]|nr:MAG: hypothetical protein M1821_008225 [Bathelium mastoideum]
MDDLEETPYYVPGSDYTTRVPSPPRIHIGLAQPVDSALSLKSAHGDPMLESLRFLDNYNYDKDGQAPEPFDWSYDMRRQAQRILPFLYLGPMNAVADRNLLSSEGITMLLAIRPTSTKQSLVLSRALRVADELGLQKGTIDAGTNSDLIASFPAAIQMINEHLIQTKETRQQGPGKVLVFCESGNDRSAAVIVAYMLHMFADMNLARAVQHVQCCRLSVNIDDSMKWMLTTYWDILEARRQVSTSTQQVNTSHYAAPGLERSSSTSSGRAGSKRGHDALGVEVEFDADGHGMEMNGRGFAPFRDVTHET